MARGSSNKRARTRSADEINQCIACCLTLKGVSENDVIVIRDR
jgi:hypothetical protein